jgi:hypothetical protein
MKISQREARRLKKRIEELEQQARSMRINWQAPYSGVHMATWTLERDMWYGTLIGARKLGKVLIARVADNGEVSFYAC